jgi:hypothetical protein
MLKHRFVLKHVMLVKNLVYEVLYKPHEDSPSPWEAEQVYIGSWVVPIPLQCLQPLCLIYPTMPLYPFVALNPPFYPFPKLSGSILRPCCTILGLQGHWVRMPGASEILPRVSMSVFAVETTIALKTA